MTERPMRNVAAREKHFAQPLPKVGQVVSNDTKEETNPVWLKEKVNFLKFNERVMSFTRIKITTQPLTLIIRPLELTRITWKL